MQELIVSPSILSLDYARVSEQLDTLARSKAAWLHFDVMDGHFVPNISYGAPVLTCLHAALPVVYYDVHLMIENPGDYIEDFVCEKTEYITVHQEACLHAHRILQKIRSLGVKVGISLNPATPLCMLEEILTDVDLVLIMSVNPGFGGQKFIPSSLDKIKRLAEIRRERDLDFLIEVDGGVTLENASDIARAGADILVAGSAVFGASDVAARTRAFKELK